MADTGPTVAIDDRHVQLDALRASGATSRDPVRFAYVEAMIRRATDQPEAIRRMLDAKISLIISSLSDSTTVVPLGITPPDPATPLTELLAYISGHAHGPAAMGPLSADTDSVDQRLRPQSRKPPSSHRPQGPELKSVAYFRNEWSKLSTEQQLTQTLAQAPENAGPMNSQHLVLRSLERMRDIAPDYLQGFMSYIDTLIWLDHADPIKSQVGRNVGNDNEKKLRATKRGTAKR